LTYVKSNISMHTRSISCHSPVAQSVEQLTVNQWVTGSSPVRGASIDEGLKKRPSKDKISCRSNVEDIGLFFQLRGTPFMGKEEFEQGSKVEEIAHQICEKIFLSDFVVSNPKYVKKSGVENEIADTLILLNSNLIGFQVKSKKEIKKLNDKTEADIARIHKRIAEGIKQLSSVKKALEAHEQLRVKNRINIEIELNTKTVQKIIGVVILDLIGEEQYPENERTEILGGFSWNDDIPVHIFMRSDLELIASEIDTPADFMCYLDMREKLYSKQILFPTVSERDYLGLYKLNPNIFTDAIANKIDGFAISEGHWDEYVVNRNDLREQRDKLNYNSYFIDKIITDLHTSIGFTDPNLEKTVMRNDLKQGTVENYFALISELASLTRLERRTVGEMLVHCLTQADKSGHSHSLYTIPEENRGILILSTKRERPSRVIALQNLTSMAYCRFGLTKIIGIATENLSVQSRSFDSIVFKNVSFENEKELIEASQTAFRIGQHVNNNEFTGNPINASPKSNDKE
jgi:hypothetical protein